MTDGHFLTPLPGNEPIQDYEPGSPERISLASWIRSHENETVEIPMVIGGKERTGEGTFEQVSPHRHGRVLARVHAAGEAQVTEAIEAAARAKPAWAAMPWEERAAIFLKAAELMAGPYRDALNGSTILGQSKSVYQSEIDAACELIDFLRFNVAFTEEIYAGQPMSSDGIWNRTDYRPLEGFVLAVSPFNFTAIGGNLASAPAMLGNVVLWKPSEKQALSAHYTMEIFREAGLPDGVINLVNGDGAMVSDVAMSHRDFAGLHFTGSAAVFRSLWQKAAENLESYRGYPRIVGEAGGKDFIVAHPSADPEALAVAMGRGAFEYQGQKCSAASRAYIPKSLWPGVRDQLAALAEDITMGDVGDLSTFMGAVIDAGAFGRHRDAIAAARDASGVEVLVGGGTDDSEGYFVEPTVLVTDDPKYDTMERELFGPILTVYVYEDAKWSETLKLVDETSPYALTGAVFSRDRAATGEALGALRNAAGNFYINDKPTGAVVGQQPFGGARASGTNDKAGSALNLYRWLSPRSLKETFVPPKDWRYPHMG
ncbi:MAG: L-glutamate gamma-semialdehyde dehydrogenase [Gemmatimonadales bacterium]|nr:MAG: L-glutamate gamma-semialdehyde dehydrogenase [Gemmatimonadales bacterium]